MSFRGVNDAKLSERLQLVIGRYERLLRIGWGVSVCLALVFSLRIPVSTPPGWSVEATLFLALALAVAVWILAAVRTTPGRLQAEMARPLDDSAYPPTQVHDSEPLKLGSIELRARRSSLVSRQDIDALGEAERPLILLLQPISLAAAAKIAGALPLSIGVLNLAGGTVNTPLRVAGIVFWLALIVAAFPRIRAKLGELLELRAVRP